MADGLDLDKQIASTDGSCDENVGLCLDNHLHWLEFPPCESLGREMMVRSAQKRQRMQALANQSECLSEGLPDSNLLREAPIVTCLILHCQMMLANLSSLYNSSATFLVSVFARSSGMFAAENEIALNTHTIWTCCATLWRGGRADEVPQVEMTRKLSEIGACSNVSNMTF
ncbi:hypothetical protein M433DRAFT_148623 [Acidomyces richmondensis BFW]|nr:MAG: hypothetical protein FE78DRAFT_87050 [Acidomyces sp. 'richmondensis']KYG50681.1 hypothetical protein M433DRAFT_148623 [Acidomyces richmondensis BFW]